MLNISFAGFIKNQIAFLKKAVDNYKIEIISASDSNIIGNKVYNF